MKSVLVISNTDDLNDTFKESESNYDVTTADDYSSILTLLETNAYDLILIDMFLYPETGLDMVGVIKSKFNGSTPKNMYIFTNTTCFNELHNQWNVLNEVAKKKGAKGVIPRPLNENDLQTLA